METSPQEISFVSVVTNVFSSPSVAASSIRDGKPSTTTWLVPLLLTCAIVGLFSYLFATNPTFHQQLSDIQSEQFQKSVQAGKMTQEQADQARDQFEKLSPAIFVVFGTIGGSIFIAFFFFGGTLVLWLIGKFALNATQGYGKYLELYGSAAMIGFLGSIITLMMMIGLNTMYASPSAALAVLSEFDPSMKLHKLLAAANVFSIWEASYIGIGLSKFSGKSTGVGIGIGIALLVLWSIIAVMLNIGR
jgi:hypothetical protein